MAAAAKAFVDEYSQTTRDVMRSLWQVIDNDKPAAGDPVRDTGIDFVELRKTLVLVREAINTERQRVAELQKRVQELEGVEGAYHAEKRAAEELRGSRLLARAGDAGVELRSETLEHDPEKWIPVFGKGHAHSKN